VATDHPTGIFVEGIGAAAATSGVLSQLQGRIFALLYLRARPLALEDIALEPRGRGSDAPSREVGCVHHRSADVSPALLHGRRRRNAPQRGAARSTGWQTALRSGAAYRRRRR
jgi:hypothetical protein